MNEKKIEPTEEMVDEAANMLSLHATGMSLRFQDGADKHTYRHRARVALRVALNRPAAPGLFADEDAIRAAREQGWDDAAQHIYNKGWEGVTALRKANPHRPALSLPTDAFATNPPADADRPWEPLNGPVRVGDEVRQERAGITTTAVVGRVDDGGDPWTDWGDPWTDGGALIGLLRHGTWYVRRAVQELPRKEGTLIVPADGREFIEAEVWGKTYYASEAILLGERDWLGAWRSPHSVQVDVTSGQITPGTWKVGNR